MPIVAPPLALIVTQLQREGRIGGVLGLGGSSMDRLAMERAIMDQVLQGDRPRPPARRSSVAKTAGRHDSNALRVALRAV